MPQTAPGRAAAAFLAVADDFRLGDLPTEQRHPLTRDLARLSNEDLPEALRILKDIDAGVILKAAAHGAEIGRLGAAMRETMATGGRVFFSGCGATGRLSLSIGSLWRSLYPDKKEQVVDFMSGGDLALVHSIENFEDHPEYGARQVQEMGFGSNDLLVASTEGGETPSVIGATEEAARISTRKPFFLYCNPDDILRRKAERSRRVLDDPGIEKICLPTGPQALSGSTRMQASTILMLAAGAALMNVEAAEIESFHDFIQKTDFSFLAAFIEEESRLYRSGDYILYETDDYGMTVLTDTTERSPTFSLAGFENRNDDPRLPSLSYLRVPGTGAPLEALEKILQRDPVTLEWGELAGAGSCKRLSGFDFSCAALGQREKLVSPAGLHRFTIKRDGDVMRFSLNGHSHELGVSALPPLLENVFLKILLNMHSTLVMGRLGRYESNVMTWVRPSNNKLVDRSIRYVQGLLENEGMTPASYEDICRVLFETMERMKDGESVVMKTFEAIKTGPQP